MVNYNNDTTIATPSIDINRVQILERRAYVIEALEKYYQYQYGGSTGNQNIVKSRISSLFWEIQETLKRKFPVSEAPGEGEMSYIDMQEILFPKKGGGDFKEVLRVWEKINIMLGEINLTKIDTKKEYDTTNIDQENEEQNL